MKRGYFILILISIFVLLFLLSGCKEALKDTIQSKIYKLGEEKRCKDAGGEWVGNKFESECNAINLRECDKNPNCRRGIIPACPMCMGGTPYCTASIKGCICPSDKVWRGYGGKRDCYTLEEGERLSEEHRVKMCIAVAKERYEGKELEEYIKKCQ